jgi:hypothetical protein
MQKSKKEENMSWGHSERHFKGRGKLQVLKAPRQGSPFLSGKAD